jgi:hypothetical protein
MYLYVRGIDFICMLEVLTSSLYTILIFDYGDVPTGWYVLFCILSSYLLLFIQDILCT